MIITLFSTHFAIEVFQKWKLIENRFMRQNILHYTELSFSIKANCGQKSKGSFLQRTEKHEGKMVDI